MFPGAITDAWTKTWPFPRFSAIILTQPFCPLPSCGTTAVSPEPPAARAVAARAVAACAGAELAKVTAEAVSMINASTSFFVMVPRVSDLIIPVTSENLALLPVFGYLQSIGQGFH